MNVYLAIVWQDAEPISVNIFASRDDAIQWARGEMYTEFLVSDTFCNDIEIATTDDGDDAVIELYDPLTQQQIMHADIEKKRVLTV